MKRFLRHRPSASMVVALLALFVALGGSATAAGLLITGKQIKDGTVAGIDIKNSSLTGSDVKDRSLSPTDFNGSVQGPAGPAGPTGPVGPAGAQGAKGDTGPAGPEGAQGERGETGAQGPAGADGAGFRWRGTWSCAATYAERDVVSQNGSSYVATAAPGACVPPSAAPWAVLARVGDIGPVGPQGAQGPQGPPGVSGYQIVQASKTMSGAPGATTYQWVTADCPPGKKVLGGGAYSTSMVAKLSVSAPQVYGNGNHYWYAFWSKRSDEGTTSTITVTAFAICGNVAN